MRQRVAVPGGRLVVDRHSRHVRVRISEGVDHAAEGEHRPARPGFDHLRFECVALGLGCNRIGGTMDGKHGRLDLAALGRLRRGQRAVHGNDGLHFGPGAGKVEDIEATEAEAHGRPPAHVTDGAPVGLARQRVERRCNAPSHSRHVRHEGP